MSRGKQTRTKFPKRVNNRAASLFELVHSDIWGPCRINSVLGFRYFIIFIDDHFRNTWLFLLKDRSELFSIFKNFYMEIQTQFGVAIHKLRSDNTQEYFSAQFKDFMSSLGILNESSCAHTP